MAVAARSLTSFSISASASVSLALTAALQAAWAIISSRQPALLFRDRRPPRRARTAQRCHDLRQPGLHSRAPSFIAQQLKREAGLEIDKRKIAVDPPIKSLGPHAVEIELHPEVTETLRIVVAAK